MGDDEEHKHDPTMQKVTSMTSIKGGQQESSGQVGNSKGAKWFEVVDEFDVTTQASFIGFAIQCLMAVSKWESMVDISNRLNSATENKFASQLLPFIIFA